MSRMTRRPNEGALREQPGTRLVEHDVEGALAALDEARLQGCAQTEVRHRCQDVVAAYDRAISEAEADLKAVLGPVEGMSRTKVIAARRNSAAQASQRVLDRLRLARQRHLLSASPACGPAYVEPGQPGVRGSMGPYWPETDYLTERKIYGTRRILSPS